MAALLKPGGTFYLSVPIGRERVEFNAHRVFDPRTILRLADENALMLNDLVVISPGGGGRDMTIDDAALQELAAAHYNLGIFMFTKT